MQRILITMGFLTSLFSSLTSATEVDLKVGDKAPAVSARNEDGQTVNVKYGTGYTMIYFYPKADTPGCTAQACSLRDAYAELTKKGVTVYGVSTDKPEDQKKFKEKFGLPFTLLADTDKKIAQAFGVPVRAGFTSRQAFLIQDGKIVWMDRSASTKEQAEDILNFLKSK